MKTCYLLSFAIMFCVGTCHHSIGGILERTTKGYYCGNRCDFYGESYSWCYTVNWWGYCSKNSNLSLHDTVTHSIRGDVCTDMCAKRGANRYWCSVDTEDGWDYCSTHVSRSNHVTATTGEYCKTPCTAIKVPAGSSVMHHTCEVYSSWDYCSPYSSYWRDKSSTTSKICYTGDSNDDDNDKRRHELHPNWYPDHCPIDPNNDDVAKCSIGYPGRFNWEICGGFDNRPTAYHDGMWVCGSPCRPTCGEVTFLERWCPSTCKLLYNNVISECEYEPYTLYPPITEPSYFD